MFLTEEDMTSVYARIASVESGIKQQEKIVAELRRLGEPTHLAEKFLRRLRDTLETRRHYRDTMMPERSSSSPGL